MSQEEDKKLDDSIKRLRDQSRTSAEQRQVQDRGNKRQGRGEASQESDKQVLHEISMQQANASIVYTPLNVITMIRSGSFGNQKPLHKLEYELVTNVLG